MSARPQSPPAPAPPAPPEPPRQPDPITLGLQLSVGLFTLPLTGYFIGRRHGQGKLGAMIGLLLAFVYLAFEIWKAIRTLNQK